jgi:hypothetical protein
MTGIVTSSASRLGVYAAHVIEAGSLAALIVAPLFVNTHGRRVFELGKASLVRALAIVMLLAFMVRCLEVSHRWIGMEGLSPRRWYLIARRWWATNPLAGPALGVLVVSAVSTVASVSPTTSVLGSYERSQGLLTTLSYIVMFLLAAGTMGWPAQAERVVRVAVFTSLPVALYGVIQGYGLDPLRWPVSDAVGLYAVTSTTGNPLSLGAYLVMVIPLTLGLLLEAVGDTAHRLEARALRRCLYGAAVFSFLVSVAAWMFVGLGIRRFAGVGRSHPPSPHELDVLQAGFHVALGIALIIVTTWWVMGKRRTIGRIFARVGVYAMLLATQVACLALTQRRGAFLGLLTAVVAFTMMSGLVRGSRRIAAGSVAIGAVLLAVFVLVNIAPRLGMGRDHDGPYGRLARVFDLDHPTARVRALIWKGTLGLMVPHAPLWSPTDGDDSLNRLRPFIGYGLESLAVTFPQSYPAELASLAGPMAIPDRAHNEVLDVLQSTGVSGVIVYLLLTTVTFAFALGKLRLIATPRQQAAFLVSWFGMAGLTALIAGVVLGWHFIGIALSGGMLLGFFLYLSTLSIIGGRSSAPLVPQAGSLTMITAALLGHFAETQFGLADTIARTYFWLLLAMLVAVGTTDSLRSDTPVGTANADARAPVIGWALLTALAVTTLAFGLVDVSRLSVRSGEAARVLDVVTGSLTTMMTTEGPRTSLAVLWLLLLTLIASVLLWTSESTGMPHQRARSIGLFTGVTLAMFFASVAAQARLPVGSGAESWSRATASFPLFVLLMFVIVLAMGAAPSSEHVPPGAYLARWWHIPVVGLLAGIAAVVVARTSIGVVQADMIHGEAGPAVGANVLASQRALQIQPRHESAFAFLGEAYLTYANDLTNAAERDELLTRAEQAFVKARELNPFNAEHTLRLGDLHRIWARHAPDQASAEHHYERALDYYSQALRLAPHLPPVAEREEQTRRQYAEFLAVRGMKPPALGESRP